jgi:hypothetical protein
MNHSNQHISKHSDTDISDILIFFARFMVFTVVVLKIKVLWDVRL